MNVHKTNDKHHGIRESPLQKENEIVKKGKKKPLIPPEELHKQNTFHLERLIESSHRNQVRSSDMSLYRQYTPRTFCGNSSPLFPKTPLKNFQSPELFAKFHLDTLFFIFYYQPGTYQQHLAAKELKKKYWKYHTKYTTWFQPQSDVRIINDAVERGTFLSFDYETTWSKQVKTDFIFDRAFCENEFKV